MKAPKDFSTLPYFNCVHVRVIFLLAPEYEVKSKMADQVSAILNDVTGNVFLILLTPSNSDHYSMILSGNGSEFICTVGLVRHVVELGKKYLTVLYVQATRHKNHFFFPFENRVMQHICLICRANLISFTSPQMKQEKIQIEIDTVR